MVIYNFLKLVRSRVCLIGRLVRSRACLSGMERNKEKWRVRRMEWGLGQGLTVLYRKQYREVGGWGKVFHIWPIRVAHKGHARFDIGGPRY